MIRDERGFTLVELLVVVAITGVIVTVLGTAIFQTLTVSGHGNARLTALHELQNAAYWFSLDGQMSAAAIGGSGLTLTLPTDETITYALTGTQLSRTFGASAIVLAINISSVSFAVAGKVVTMNITSAPPGRIQVIEQGTYSVNMRPDP